MERQEHHDIEMINWGTGELMTVRDVLSNFNLFYLFFLKIVWLVDDLSCSVSQAFPL